MMSVNLVILVITRIQGYAIRSKYSGLRGIKIVHFQYIISMQLKWNGFQQNV